MIGGGADRSWLIPLDTEGNRPSEHQDIEGDVIGCHVGMYSALNIQNPQPGFEYYWALDPARGGGRMDQSSMNQIRQRGGEIVKDSDPEQACYRHLMSEMSPASMDGNTVYNELCLVRVREDVMRAEREELDQLNQNRLRRGPEAAFVGQRSHSESMYSGGRGPTRFRLQDHHSELQSGGHVEEIITPDPSIVKTEGIA